MCECVIDYRLCLVLMLFGMVPSLHPTSVGVYTVHVKQCHVSYFLEPAAVGHNDTATYLFIQELLLSEWQFPMMWAAVFINLPPSIMQDILAGLFIAIIMLLLGLPALPFIDWLVFDYKYTLIAAPLLVIFLVYIYPVEPDSWSVDRGDTAAILGVGLGGVLGCHLHGRFPDDLDPGPFEVVLPSLQVVGVGTVRFVVGVLVVLPTRFIMKLLCFKLLPVIMPTHGVEEVVKRPLVELPYKIITYSMISLNVAFFAFYTFEMCNISRF